jgi:hypothetical protein
MVMVNELVGSINLLFHPVFPPIPFPFPILSFQGNTSAQTKPGHDMAVESRHQWRHFGVLNEPKFCFDHQSRESGDV